MPLHLPDNRQTVDHILPARRCHRPGFHDLLILISPAFGEQFLFCFLLAAFRLLVLIHASSSFAQNSGFYTFILCTAAGFIPAQRRSEN